MIPVCWQLPQIVTTGNTEENKEGVFSDMLQSQYSR